MPKHPNLTPEQINESNADFARCRALRHAWDPIGGGGGRRPQFGELICLRCIFCGTLRYDKFSRLTGERIDKPQYDHPPGYRDVGRHTSAWWRANWAETISDKLVQRDTPIEEGDNVVPINRRTSA